MASRTSTKATGGALSGGTSSVGRAGRAGAGAHAPAQGSGTDTPEATAASSAGGASAEAGHPFNEVRLVGRVAAAVEERTLPSGDVVSTFRVIVPRAERTGTGAGRQDGRKGGVDTIDCIAWRPGLRRTVNAWHEGDTVAVTGALRRRFWRGETGAASRHEIEVSKATRVRRAAP